MPPGSVPSRPSGNSTDSAPFGLPPVVVLSRRRLSYEGSILRRRRRFAEAGAADGRPVLYVQPVGDAPGRGPAVPDLLHAEPRVWGDLTGAKELVRFAFEGGDCAGVFDVLVEALPLAPSRFTAEAFAPQLYLDELVRACFQVTVDGKKHATAERVLSRILSSPPESAADVDARQATFRELVDRPELRADLERLYVGVRRLRDALEASSGAEPQVVRRKIAVLAAAKECIDAMAEGFEGAGPILARLRAHGEAARGKSAYERVTELLDFDSDFATVDVRLRLGSDGRIRGFAVLAVRENTDNALLPGPVLRFFQRIVSWLRGYRYGESEVVVRLLDEVFAPLVDDVVVCLAMTAAIETYLAGLGFRDLARSKGLDVSLPEIVDGPALAEEGGPKRELEGLFNPLLFLQSVTPKPCTLPVPRHDALVVITGPNSGGKTRLLQALALAQLLGQAGMFVPASRARLVRAPSLFVSLVHDVDAAQVEGRLGTELLRVRRLFEQLEPGALAILDELCSGTNPMEGEAIFEMVVRLLPRLRPQVFVSTHFLGMAARLEREPPVPCLEFLQVELDAEERPTFGFVPGVATTSLAHKIAARLGVTEEEFEALVAAKAKERG